MIEAKIIADSVSEAGDRITTFELVYPRFIHAELMTHRLFSRNAASSRAIPIDKTLEMVENEPAAPVEWGKNQAGMQAKEVLSGSDKRYAISLWMQAARSAAEQARKLQEAGLHKQIVNRVLEPFVHMKTIVTATEYDNWWWLRCHPDAQPEIRVLAESMKELYNYNKPMLLKAGEWHLPYVETNVEIDAGAHYVSNGAVITTEHALKISASCCAQVSFRNSDDSLDKAVKIYDRLVSSKPIHASPFEHQATPIGFVDDDDIYCLCFPEGVTHFSPVSATETLSSGLWSGNFKGWIQNRQLIDDNACWDYNTIEEK